MSNSIQQYDYSINVCSATMNDVGVLNLSRPAQTLFTVAILATVTALFAALLFTSVCHGKCLYDFRVPLDGLLKISLV